MEKSAVDIETPYMPMWTKGFVVKNDLRDFDLAVSLIRAQYAKGVWYESIICGEK